MKSCFLLRAAVGLTVAGLLPAAAMAQTPPPPAGTMAPAPPGWTPGSELVGQPIQVTTNGTMNTVYLDPGGQLRIMTPGGNTVPGTWTASNGQLCISANGAQECVPYNGPFQAGAPMALTSSCGASETWLAQSTNAPPPPPPAAGQRGERGR
jgi:hypothetical protein